MLKNNGTIAPGESKAPTLLLNREELAGSLGISVRKLDEITAAQDSGIPVVRIGSCVRFPVDCIKQWLADHVGSTIGR